MHFAATAAVVLQLFGKIAVFEQVQLVGVDVLVMTIEYTYDYTFEPEWKKAVADCLDKTFLFGVDENDSRFASACSFAIITYKPDESWVYFSLWTSNPMTVSLYDTCPGNPLNPRDYNEIKRYLEKFKSDFFMGHRNSSSVVTFLFADKTLKNNIDSAIAKWFVDWPNRLFLALERGYAGKEADLAKNGITQNHLLNFTVGQCPEFSKHLQHLLCRDEDEAPTPFPCTKTSAGSESCTEGKRYNASKLLQAETICANILVDETPCNCTTASTVVSNMSSSTTAKYDEDEIMSRSVIAAIVIGLIVVLMVTTGLVWFFVCRRRGGSSGPVGARGGSQAGAGAGGSQAPPSSSQLAEGGASQKSASKQPKSASKQPQKTAKSGVGSQSKTGASKIAKLDLGK